MLNNAESIAYITAKDPKKAIKNGNIHNSFHKKSKKLFGENASQIRPTILP